MELPQTIFVGSLVVALLFYAFYSPIPSEIDEPWKLRLCLASAKMEQYVASAGEYLGFESRVNLTRSIQEKTADVTDTDPDLEIDDTFFHGIRVRVYKPRGRSIREKSAGIIYFHGGGWVYGSVLTYDVLTRTLAKKTKMVVASVDYRLAPEFPFPTPFFDCEIATKYFIENANSLNVDPNRITVMGDDAGGNMAAAVALKLRSDEIKIKPKLQVLIYPLVQAIDYHLPSYMEKTHFMPEILTTKKVVTFLMSYMGVQNDTMVEEFMRNDHTSAHVKQHYYKHTDVENLPEEFIPEGFKPAARTGGNIEISRRYEAFYLNQYFSPLLAEDHTNLPSAYILICEHDVTRDDGMLYAKKLGKGKVSVKVEHYKRGFHGMLSLVGDFKIADKMMDDIAEYLLEKL
ncbi:arylacetamide deacetylase-like [Lineus longissimus]|uniref:arylacetamide deacetylase-like n=1 Tax=Lineus longissimus TaxID=88925 RepID=UPI002B4D614A